MGTPSLGPEVQVAQDFWLASEVGSVWQGLTPTPGEECDNYIEIMLVSEPGLYLRPSPRLRPWREQSTQERPWLEPSRPVRAKEETEKKPSGRG